MIPRPLALEIVRRARGTDALRLAREEKPLAPLAPAPAPAEGGGFKPEPELDRLSNILRAFNDQFGSIEWGDRDRVQRLITEDIPERVSADTAYQNAQRSADVQNARIELDRTMTRVMNTILKDDIELFKPGARSGMPARTAVPMSIRRPFRLGAGRTSGNVRVL